MASFASSRALASSRAASEDRIVVIEHGDTLVVAVADGAGGMRGGAAASDAFVRAVERSVAEEDFELHDARRWHAVFAELDARLAAGMTGETTALVIVLSPRSVSGTSVGDSEAWLLDPSSIDDLTSAQANKRLGSGRARPLAFTRPPLTSTLLAATDGLFKYATPVAIANAARANVADDLLALVRLPSGRYPDDVAFVRAVEQAVAEETFDGHDTARWHAVFAEVDARVCDRDEWRDHRHRRRALRASHHRHERGRQRSVARRAHGHRRSHRCIGPQAPRQRPRRPRLLRAPTAHIDTPRGDRRPLQVRGTGRRRRRRAQ